MTIQTVAALQMKARTADVNYNLDHVRELAMEAVRKGAKIIAVPEFFTTTIVMDNRIWECALPPQNKALDLLTEIAIDHNVLIGGSYLEKRDGDIYNCYTMVRPNGKITRHDKDLPTMVENSFYIGGKSDGIHLTQYGTVGTALCWELIRTQTLRRLLNKIDFIMSGTHWWTIATNWKVLKAMSRDADRFNRAMYEVTPQVFARNLGVANIHAAHCGSVKGKYPILPAGLWAASYETTLLGGTQIIDNKGEILAHLGADDGPGVLTADIDLAPSKPTLDIPDRFWVPDMPILFKLNWWHQNFLGKGIYKSARKAERF